MLRGGNQAERLDDWDGAEGRVAVSVAMSGAAGQTAPPPFNILGVTTVQKSGNDSNRIGIVFLGDGYTAGEIAGAYMQHVSSFASYLFTGGMLAEPFNRYRNFFNVYAVNLVSNQSGADDPTSGITVDTALNARYRWDGVTERLMSIDSWLGDQALAQAIGGTTIRADIKLVTVNASKYGGAGGSFSVYAGGNASSHEIALHEMGHSFGNLADEYSGSGTGGGGGSHYSGPDPVEANVTTSPAGAKWARWLGYVQDGIGTIGAYEGGRYYTTGIYRPSLNSKMRNLDSPFDAVAREQFILRFYSIVRPIDSATAGTNLTDPGGLTVNVIDPGIIRLRWSVDNVTVSDGALRDFAFESFNVPSGTHAVSALAYDPTDWVRADRSSLEQRVSWTVTLTHATLRSDGVNPLAGGPLADTLIASDKADRLSGGDGNDTLSYALSTAGVTVRLSTNSAAGGFAAGDTISGFENVTGSAHDDELEGDGGANVLNGGAGNDTLIGGSGADRMIGGAGNDVYNVDDAGDLVEEGADAGLDSVFTGLAGYTLPANVENLSATNAVPHDFRGNALSNSVAGGAGNDTLRLHDGGSDQASGHGGSDILFFGGSFDSSDRPNGGDGVDTLVLQGNYPSLLLDAESLVGIEGISLQSGSVTRWGEAGTNSYDYSLRTVEANVAPGQQLRINAQSLLAGEDFALDGSAETDGGRFLAYAGFGADTLTGGSGNDIFFFEAGRFGAADRVVGGAGNDALVISGAPAGHGFAAIAIRAGTFSGIESLSFNGRFASDPLARPSYDVAIEDGNLAGGATLIVNASSLDANQSLFFSGWAVGDGRFRIFGGAGGDSLRGGAGDDIIEGGGLGDALWGGYGRDVFVYRNLSDSAGDAPDVIGDFHFGNDKIDLSLLDADALQAGDQAFAWIGGEAFSGTAGELRVAFDGGMNMWALLGDVNGDGAADFRLLVSTGAGPPPVADIIL
jgi:Ca2+-binding RTX toxin-like protein